jgi:hypothetical protein
MPTRTYNPASGTKIGFFNKFVKSYLDWRAYGFRLGDFNSDENPDFREREGIEVLGMDLTDYLGKVRVFRYSQTLEYSERKKRKVGSVHIIAMDARDAKKMLGQLEKMTQIKLNEVSRE